MVQKKATYVSPLWIVRVKLTEEGWPNLTLLIEIIL